MDTRDSRLASRAIFAPTKGTTITYIIYNQDISQLHESCYYDYYNPNHENTKDLRIRIRPIINIKPNVQIIPCQGVNGPNNMHVLDRKDLEDDRIKPIWKYESSSINRKTEEVTVRFSSEDENYDKNLIDFDKYGMLDSDTSKIKILLNNTENGEITKTCQKVDGTRKKYIYEIVLGEFKKHEDNVKIKIPAGTALDIKGNGNVETSINVGNPNWVENGDNSSNPKYKGFRSGIVDFTRPRINYKYSKVENKNPDINKENKTLTVSFDVEDSNLLTSNITKDNIKIYIDGENVSNKLTNKELTSVNTNNGKRYKLVIRDMVVNEILQGEKYQNYSGPVQLVFDENLVDDTSGNKNLKTTISVNTQNQSSEDREKINIGDYVDYIPDVNNNEVNGATQEKLEWRVLEKYADGRMKLIATTPQNLTRITYSADGYNSFVNELNTTSKMLYSNKSQNIIARNIKIEDIEEFIIPGKDLDRARNENQRNPKKEVYKGKNKRFYPAIYGLEKGSKIDGRANGTLGRSQEGNATGYLEAKSSLEVSERDYFKDIKLKYNLEQQRLGLLGNSDFTIASRNVNIEKTLIFSSKATFGAFIYIHNSKGEPIIGKSVLYTNTGEYQNKTFACSFKPIVDIGTNVGIIPCEGTNSSTNMHKIIENTIIDFVKPNWSCESSSINNETQEVNFVIKGTDKYLKYTPNLLNSGNIQVYVGNTLVEGAEKVVTEETHDDISVRYTIKVKNLGNVSGQVKIKIAANTLEDKNGNKSSETILEGPIISDLVKPKWSLIRKGIEHDSGKLVFEVEAYDENYKVSSIDNNKIKVYTNDQENNGIIKEIVEVSEGQKATGKVYKIKLSGFEGNVNKVKIEIAKGTITDEFGNINDVTSFEYQGTIDMKKPVWNYQNSSIDNANKTITFNVKASDENYQSTNLTQDNLKVYVNGTLKNVTKQVISKGIVNNSETFEIKISGLDENTTKVKIELPAGAIKDKAGNLSDAKAYDYPETIDFKKPVWNYITSSIDVANKTITFNVKASDENYQATNLTKDNLKVYVNGTLKNVTKQVISKGIVNNSETFEIKISGLDENTTKVKIELPAGAIRDKAGNSSDTKAYDYPETIDFKKPIWNLLGSEINPKGKEVIFNVKGYDQNLKESNLLSNDITVYVNGSVNGNIARKVENISSDTTTVTKKITLTGFDENTTNVKIEIASGTIKDHAGNVNDKVTFEHPKVIDFKKPIWTYVTSSIDRQTQEVTIDVKGTDEHYKSSNLIPQSIKVFIDDIEKPGKVKEVKLLNSDSKSATYRITLNNFGKDSGKTRIEIAENTIQDLSGDTNIRTSINVGNPSGDAAFKQSIVDFVKPTIKYKYSAVETKNPDINHQTKTLTVSFDATDKYNYTNDIRKEDIQILVDGQILVGKPNEQDKLTSTLTSENIANGKRYKLVVKDFDVGKILQGEQYANYSGPVQVVFAENRLSDTSGNRNDRTTITIDYDDGDDTNNPIIVDTVNPIWQYERHNIDRTKNEVILEIKGTDKYYKEITLSKDNIKVFLDGVENNTINKEIIEKVEDKTSVKLKIKLSNFGENSGNIKVQLPAGTLKDNYGNVNKMLEISSIGLVDFIKPVWQYETSSIDRTKKEVYLTIKGSDKYLQTNSLTKENIKVFVGNNENTSITKNLEPITGTPETEVKYKVTLGNFGNTEDIVKIKIDKDTLKDTSNNGNIETTIEVGNKNHKEPGDTQGKYSAFSQSIVDFIKPTIKYKYSAVEKKNPDINYQEKKVTVSFDVTDKQILTNNMKKEDIQIKVDGTDITSNLNRTLTSTNIANGKRYTLVISNFDVGKILPGDQYKNYSGPMQLVFAKDIIDDTSGNKNNATTITIDTKEGEGKPGDEIIVDLVDPMWQYIGSTTNRETDEVVITVKGTDKYYKSSNLDINKIKVFIDNVETTINKEIISKVETETSVTYEIKLSNFANNSGKVKFELAKGTVTDKSGNVSAAKTFEIPEVIDFIKPVWEYETSSIDRISKQVSVTIKGSDKHLQSNSLKAENIKVFVGNSVNTNITKTLEPINTNNPKEVKYKVILGNFGNIEDVVKIEIAKDTLKDTSNNGNDAKQINVGNPNWNKPGDTAFKQSIVDFTKPTIKYKYSSIEKKNPDINHTSKTLTVSFDATDKYNYTNDIRKEDIQILVDGQVVVGKANVKDQLTSTLTSENITNGKRYTLVVKDFDVGKILPGEQYANYSGPVQVVFAENRLADTSGNKNIKTTITIDTNEGNSRPEDGIVVDVVDPIWSYQTSSIDRINNEVELKVRGSDKYLDKVKSKLELSNVKVLVNGQENNTITKEIAKEEKDNTGITYTIKLKTFGQIHGKVSIKIPTGSLIDTSGNKNKETTIDVGNPEWNVPGDTAFGQSIVDFVKPTWNYVGTTIDRTYNEVSIEITGTDTYYAGNTLNANNLKIYFNGNLDSDIKVKSITTIPQGNANVRYKIILNNFGTKAGNLELKILADTLKDTSGNGNIETSVKPTETIDFTKPEWKKTGSSIDRINETVTVDLLGEDPFYKVNTLTSDKVIVYVDNKKVDGIGKTLTEVGTTKTSTTQKLVLSNFGKYSGKVRIEILENTLEDTSGNKNIKTSIDVGNPNWNKPGDTAFRESIVDFIKPTIKYKYSAIEKKNPDINHQTNTLTVSFDATDKYNYTNDIRKEDIQILVDGQILVGKPNEQDKLTSTLTSEPITNGKKYTLVVEDFDVGKILPGEQYANYSGPVQVVFAKDRLVDTSGNKNNQTTITIDTNEGNSKPEDGIVVDVVDPIWTNIGNTINRNDNTVSIELKGSDKYLQSSKIEGKDIGLYDEKDKPITEKITKTVIPGIKDATSNSYRIVLGNFGNYSGIVKVKIAKGTLTDTSGNVNKELEINNIGLVDFIKPVWQYETSSIDRTKKEVYLTIKGLDKYLQTNSLTKDNIKVFVGNNENTSITKNLEHITGTPETEVKYKVTLGNFGNTEDIVKIKIDKDTLKDTSNNGNIETTIEVGNKNHKEPGDTQGKYPAFSQSIVDFIKPTIKYKYSAVEKKNPDINYQEKKITISFDVTDKQILTNNMKKEDIQIKVDGTDITSSLNRTLTSTNIANGKRYTLVISNFDVGKILPGDQYKNYSGPMQLVFAKDIIDDTSGNKNNATTITIDTKEGQGKPGDEIIVDLVDPMWQYVGSTTNRETNEVVITVKGTDKYYKSSNLDINKIKVFIDNVETSINKEIISKVETETSVTYEIKLSNFGTNNGYVKLELAKGTITDKSGNVNPATTIEEPHIVDFIKPIWKYETSSIDRQNKKVVVDIIGQDKHYKSNTLTAENIKVIFNETAQNNIRKTLTKISENNTEVKYRLTLENFGEDSGVTKIEIPENTIKDINDNGNIKTTIEVGNKDWLEPGDNKENPKYTAFRNNIVDFVKPIWSYKVSSIDRQKEEVTLEIKGTDKYYLENTLTENNIRVYIDGKENKVVSKKLDNISKKDSNIVEYKLTLGNFGTNNGKVNIKINPETIKDTSGNGNIETSIDVGNPNWVENGDDKTNPKYIAFRESIVDFVKPTWQYKTSSINRKDEIVELNITGTDKDYLENTLTENKIKVMIVEGNKEVESTTISKKLDKATSTNANAEYKLTLGNFGTYSGKVKIIINPETMKDRSGNGNIETSINVGNPTWKEEGDKQNPPKYPAFRESIVDFIKPVIKYKYSAVETKNPDINYQEKTLTVRFDTIDKHILGSNVTENDIQILVDKVDITSRLNKQLTSIEIKDENQKVIGKQYTLVVSNFELENILENEEYKNYSGPVQLIFKENLVDDTSGNKNDKTTITIDTSEGESKPEDGIIVDVVNPIWSYKTSSIDRQKEEVTLEIKGTDKYYSKNTLTADKITVYVDDKKVDGIGKTLTEVETTKTSNTKKLVLSNFGQYSGKVRIEIAENTLEDTSGNKNIRTSIDVGNKTWKEPGDTQDPPKYPAFRQSIVDFIKPVIKYKYSAVETKNPDINYQEKTLTVRFDTIDKHILGSNVTENDIQILVDGADITNRLNRQLTFTEIKDENQRTIGKQYTLVVSNFELENILENEEYKNYSGPVQLIFKENLVDDTSGNKNDKTTITIDTSEGESKPEDGIVVDVVNPIWSYKTSSIDRQKEEVTLEIKGTDKYYSKNTLTADKITVYVDDKKVDRIGKTLTEIETTKTSTTQKLVLSNFGEYSGKVRIEIAENTLEDTSGNKNIRTSIDVGNKTWKEPGDTQDPPKYPAFSQSVVDFIKPVWKYSTSSIDRTKKEVTLEFKGFDKQYLEDDLNENDIKIFVDDVENTEITKKLVKTKSETNKEEVVCTLVLGNFGNTNGKVKIQIPENKIRDTSGNFNKQTEIFVGNPKWVEIGDNKVDPKYKAFRESIVDFINPEWSYITSDIDRKKNVVNIEVKGTDKHYQENILSNSTSIKVFIDDKEHKEISKYVTKKQETNSEIIYNIQLGGFKENEGKVRIEIQDKTIRDSSGNGNEKVTYDVGNKTWVEEGDNKETPKYTAFRESIVDFVKPKISYTTSEINRDNQTVIVTVTANDKYYLEEMLKGSENSQTSGIEVYVDNTKQEGIISKILEKTETNTSVTYKIELSNFGNINGETRIEILENNVFDTSGNGNIKTPIDVGNKTWVEKGDNSKNPKYTAFRKNIVDFVKPIIKYEYSETTFTNPNIDHNLKRLTISFDAIDKYFLDTNLELKDIRILVDGEDITEQLGKKLKMGELDNGKRYLLELTNFEKRDIGEGENYKNYSGPIQLIFNPDKVSDTSGNKNANTTITIDRKDGQSKPEDGIVVDFIKPIWSYKTSRIDRIKKEVEVEVEITDKYYLESRLTDKDITVIADGKVDSTIGKTVTKLDSKKTNTSETYKILLTNFTGIGNEIKLDIKDGIAKDQSGNLNDKTTIPVGNPTWVEAGDNKDNPRYTGFRESIVDFAKPVIKYQYSETTVSNPNIDYQKKTVTIKFNVVDRKLIDNPLTTADIKILVDGIDISEKLTKNIEVEYLALGNLYTLTLSDFELAEILENQDYKDYSGPVQLLFEANRIEDTSGNKNEATTITIDYDNGDDTDKPIIVDVVDPTWRYQTSKIDRIKNEVEVELRGTDKYLAKNDLNMNNLKVLIDDKEHTNLIKNIQKVSNDNTSVVYRVTLGNFGENAGVVKLKLLPGSLEDSSKNKNIETEILVGNKEWVEEGDAEGKYTAFRESIVDFTKPKIEYVESSKDRLFKKVTLETKLNEKYYYNYEIKPTDIKVFVNDTEIPDIVRNITSKVFGNKAFYTIELEDLYNYPGEMYIQLNENVIYDTSGNGNTINNVYVGNPKWKEQEEFDKAFDKNIVDFREPKITYKYVKDQNPIIDNNNKVLTFELEVEDQYLDYEETESAIIRKDEIQVFVDNEDAPTVNKEIALIEKNEMGQKYKVTLKDFEDEVLKKGKEYLDYSGVVKLKVKENALKDTSANSNIETDLVVADENNKGIIIDFLDPKIYYATKKIDIPNKVNIVELKGTDKYYDDRYKLTLDDMTMSINGRDMDIKDHPIYLTTTKIDNGYSYKIEITELTKEGELIIDIPEKKIFDTHGRWNQALRIVTSIDNKKPEWKYLGCDSTSLDKEGKMNFKLSASDRFLVMDQSNLTSNDIQILVDGEDITSSVKIDVNPGKTAITEDLRTKEYDVSLSGINKIGAVTVVIKKDTLIDEDHNKSNTQTITFSKSRLSSNNYTEVTYFVNDNRINVNELANVNETGTNDNSVVYMPSSLGEIWNENRNLDAVERNGKTFKGWLEADSEGEIIYYTDSTLTTKSTTKTEYTRMYKLYDEIPNTIMYLRAVFEDGKVIFVSSKGNNQNTGLTEDKPVQNLETAFSKLSQTGTVSNQKIVIMDEINWTSSNNSNMINKNATITNVYNGKDYRKQHGKLKISANMEMNADLMFDNIKIDAEKLINNGKDMIINQNPQNMLICNYHELIMGRDVTSTEGKYTFGTIIGGNYKEEKNTGNIGNHKMKIERGKYENIIIGSVINTPTNNKKYVSHNIEIGNKKDGTRAQNNRLTIDGYLVMGENEKEYYPVGTSNYLDINLYSGTFTGIENFKKQNENASIYLRTLNGNSEGKVMLKMYGGDVKGGLYAGSRIRTTNPTDKLNVMNFYGGKVEGNIYGQGTEKNYFGSSEINLSGIFEINGNIFGGGNSSVSGTGYGTGNTNINIQSSSVKVIGNIYGGSNGIDENTTKPQNGYINGSTNIIINAGKITGNVFGGGNNAGVGTNNNTLRTNIENAGTTNIQLNGGQINGNVYGGSTNHNIGVSTNIKVTGSADINGNIFGGNLQTNANNIGIGYEDGQWFMNASQLPNFKTTNIYIDGGSIGTSGQNNKIYGANSKVNNNFANDNILETTNITIDAIQDEDGMDILPIIYATIYGSGTYDKVGTTNVHLLKETIGDRLNVYGGSDTESQTDNTNIYLQGGIVSEIYGGSNGKGNVTNSNLILEEGEVINAYGAGNKIGVQNSNVNTQARGFLNIGTIYGGSNTGGNTQTTNLNLGSGNVGSVYGGSNKSNVENANIDIKGISANEIYGGSNISGKTNNVNITISGSSNNIFAGGNETDVDKAKVISKYGSVSNLYGGSKNKGKVTTSELLINGGGITNIFGGGLNSNVENSKVILQGGNHQNVYGGSEKSGIVNNSSVELNSGNIENVFGGGLKTGVVNPQVTLKGAIVKNIYGGNNTGGNIENTNVTIQSGEVENVFGGNKNGGTTTNSNILIKENANITKYVYGGGFKSQVGTNDKQGTVNINMTGGRVGKDINGGSKQSVVYGNININVGNVAGKDTITESINIGRHIYGSGASELARDKESENEGDYNYDYVSVYGNINININGKGYRNIKNSGSIFGAGNSATYNGTANLKIKDYGTLGNEKTFISIQRLNNVELDNSHIELEGTNDKNNYYKDTSYSFNRIDSLTLNNNTYVYLRRGVNLVKEFNSISGYDANGKKIFAEANMNNDKNQKENRLYVTEGINIIFKKIEGEIQEQSSYKNWGDVNGMTFFGMYGIGRSGNFKYDIYDPKYNGIGQEDASALGNYFVKGSFIEGSHKPNHDLAKDGFYTNIKEPVEIGKDVVKKKYIDVLSHTTPYYDWIIGEDTFGYETTLTASVYATEVTQSIKLDYKYKPGTEYTISRISISSLPKEVELLKPSEIPYIATEEKANTNFALTMNTSKSGWINESESNILTRENGSYEGNTLYKSDNSNEYPELNLRLTNSTNITKRQDLGSVKIILTAKTKTTEDSSEGEVFNIVLTVNLKTSIQENEFIIKPSFKDRKETKLAYTNDSNIDLSYLFYKSEEERRPDQQEIKPLEEFYEDGDYRVITSNYPLVTGTKLTLVDYGEDLTQNKVYYYQIPDTLSYDAKEGSEIGKEKYIYKLSHFKEMGSTNTNYVDDKLRYYHPDGKFLFEKYDLSVDLEETENYRNQVDQKIYMEIRNARGTEKAGNGKYDCTFDLLMDKNAKLEEKISNRQNVYETIRNKEIGFDYEAKFIEQMIPPDIKVLDTKYYDKKIGASIEICDMKDNRININEIGNLVLTTSENEEYFQNDKGIIRFRLTDGFSQINKKMNFIIQNLSVKTGKYKVKVIAYTSEDGLYPDNRVNSIEEFYLNAVKDTHGFKVDMNKADRIFRKKELENKKNINATIRLTDTIDNTNLRVELYKRNPTYIEETYGGISYTTVDLNQYVEIPYRKPSFVVKGSNDYSVPGEVKPNYSQEQIINFTNRLKTDIETGEYKLQFKICIDEVPIQIIEKTFLVVE